MLRILLPIFGVVTVLLGLAAPAAQGQACPNGTDNFWKNDTLPQVPGLVTAAVIQGMCEGEAAAQVFDISGVGAQKINTVSVGFGHGGGGNGFEATCNIEIYDGITWAGGVPTLGPKVFDLGDDLAAEMLLTSHAINTFDLSGQNIIVSESHFVVAFRMAINLNGTCGGGHPANFMTDAGFSLFTCDTIPETSLIDILGEGGWQDASTATVGGVPICVGQIGPFNGNWLIRACTQNSGGVGTGTFNNLGFSLPGNFSPTLNMRGSLLPSPDQYNFDLDNMPPNTTMILLTGFTRIDSPFFYGGTLVPAPDLLVFFASGPFGQTGFSNSMPSGVPSGFTFYLHGWIADAGGPFGFSATNAMEIIFP